MIMMHQNLDQELNLNLSRQAMVAHCQASRDRGQDEAVREALAQIVGATCFLKATLGQDYARAVAGEILVSIDK